MQSLRQECSGKDERITELESAVKAQQAQLAEVPLHLDKMRLAKEVCTLFHISMVHMTFDAKFVMTLVSNCLMEFQC
jgi:hypothetical protein